MGFEHGARRARDHVPVEDAQASQDHRRHGAIRFQLLGKNAFTPRWPPKNISPDRAQGRAVAKLVPLQPVVHIEVAEDRLLG